MMITQHVVPMLCRVTHVQRYLIVLEWSGREGDKMAKIACILDCSEYFIKRNPL